MYPKYNHDESDHLQNFTFGNCYYHFNLVISAPTNGNRMQCVFKLSWAKRSQIDGIDMRLADVQQPPTFYSSLSAWTPFVNDVTKTLSSKSTKQTQ